VVVKSPPERVDGDDDGFLEGFSLLAQQCEKSVCRPELGPNGSFSDTAMGATVNAVLPQQRRQLPRSMLRPPFRQRAPKYTWA
jgi:hypothetical protein